MYAFPDLISLIPEPITRGEYEIVGVQFEKLMRTSVSMINDETKSFWQKLPVLKYAQCPFCGYVLSGRVNVYSLAGWLGIDALYATLYEPINGWLKLHETTILRDIKMPNFPHCEHFMGVGRFIVSHHCALPNPLKWKVIDTVKLLNSLFVPDKCTKAIFHATPLYDVMQNETHPLYTVFSITYFSEDRQLIFWRWEHRESIASMFSNDRDCYPSFFLGQNADSTNLNHWVLAGKLGWLDVHEATLPLRFTPSEPPPHLVYANAPNTLGLR